MDLEELRRLVHARWNWTKEGYPNLKETGPMAKAAHLQTHLSSTVGKLASYIGRHHHGLGLTEPNKMRQVATVLCANLVLDALELANIFEVKTEDLIQVIEHAQHERSRPNSTA